MSHQLIAELFAALEQADLYLNSYDTSAPSRIKAETRAAVETAIGLARSSVPAAVLKPEPASAAGLDRILGRPRPGDLTNVPCEVCGRLKFAGRICCTPRHPDAYCPCDMCRSRLP